MKRWQDRGEVLDSDDEEESQGSERIAKQAELVEDGRSHAVLGDEEKISNSNILQQNVWQSREQLQEQRQKIEDLPFADIPELGERKVLDEHATGWKGASDGLNSGRHFEKFYQSSPSARSEGLPEIRDVLGGIHQQLDQQQRNEASAPSSPLTEREVSPPPLGATFRFPRLGLGPLEDDRSEQDSEDDVRFPSQPEEVHPEVLSAAQGRRNLRARKEKQLHPYLFDKAQHQKQFKERGMRPIRYEPERREAETQEALLSGNEEGTQSFDDETEMRHEPSSELGMETFSNNIGANTRTQHQLQDPSSSDEELAEQPLFNRPPLGTATYSNKRRKLFHPSRFLQSGNEVLGRPSAMQLTDSVPPSPPPTSSDGAVHAPMESATGRFRMPRGLTPEALPTPQISSELRDGMIGDDDTQTEAESLAPRSRPSTISRRHVREVAMSSPSEASEAEPEAEMVDRRLHQERKRIRGVLPASWLKIDFRAQQKQLSPSPRRARRDSSHSPARTVPQKGVAQRVLSKTTATPSRQDPITISDDESSEPRSPGSPLLPAIRQSRLNFERESTAAAPLEVLDDEDMEIDWVDPMFAGSSRPRSGQQKGRRRQPRITESFTNRHTSRLDFSEEPDWKRQRAVGIPRSTKSSSRHLKLKQRRSPPAVRLSILDAPDCANSTWRDQPQFLRIAVRRARTQTNHARHSPTHKQIRLATLDDTEDAWSVLRSWREGTILPRDASATQDRGRTLDRVMEEHSEGDTRDYVSSSRAPLAEIQHNKQRQLPLPQYKEHTRRINLSSTSKSSRASRTRQTQLRPIVIPDQDHVELQDDSRENIQTPASGKTRQNQKHVRVHVQPARYRAAQLESLENAPPGEYRASAFRRRMHLLTEHVVRSHRQLGKGVQLDRFFNHKSSLGVGSNSVQNERDASGSTVRDADTAPLSTRISLPRRPRKHQPNHINAESREYRQPSEPLPTSTEALDPEDEPPLKAPHVLPGLGPFGTRYATHFDILPLPLDTHFHRSSFIGSGDFAASLNFADRDLDVPSGHIRVHLNGDVLEWGAWTEDVAAGLSRIPKAVFEVLQSLDTDDPEHSEHETLALILANVDYLLRSTVRYFMWCLYFFDPVDRLQCISSLTRLIDDLLETLIARSRLKEAKSENVLSRGFQYVVVLCRQQLGLCENLLVAGKTKRHAEDALLRAASCLVDHSFPRAFQELRAFYEEIHSMTKSELGICDDDTAICSVFILYYATQNAHPTTDLFWKAINNSLAVESPATNTVSRLDQVWYDLFTILPALEIDLQGQPRVGSRFRGKRENWTVPRSLIKRLFTLYPATILEHGTTINEYLRATLNRCSYLISRWGWWKCEFFLGTVFDFFSKRGLKQLHNEEVRGSPRFLDELHQRPSLEAQSEDRAFHILLKMLATGLQGMRKYEIYPDKRIGGIAWRFIPNHGRTYRKDAELLQEDLDALRNHHDLLCVSYCFAPPSNRVRVNIVQNLVDHSVSHREACRLNVRAWQRLASFEVSINEDELRLDELGAWYRDMMTITINQYQLARTEIEHDIAAARTDGTLGLSSSAIEDTIARNQRQIAATLIDLLAALKIAMQASRNAAIARHLLEASCFWQFFSLFEPSERRLYGVLSEALNVVRFSLETQAKFRAQVETNSDSEESQEYGDSIALQQLVSVGNEDQDIADCLHAPLATLLSNVFGADITTDDDLLTAVVDVWVILAHLAICKGRRTWSSYISGYDSDAWAQLRDTEQKRKYTPYFLSRLIERADGDLAESDILTFWLQCLVEREAKLKFQHALTNALLTRHPHEPLLNNLPFSRREQIGYTITINELRQRRLPMISSVLSNMRESFSQSLRFQPSAARQLRQTYAAMLRHLMQSMKENYQELQASSGKQVAEDHVAGAYVSFVQQVVAFLQEYTTDLCAVDRFFTDSPAFPLPTNDPTYVVGRLRSYVPKLSESGRRKELSNFVHNVCERAIMDQKQAYLIDQMVSAMSSPEQRANQNASRLRQVLCCAIFPAYIENALSTACSWIMAEPILTACRQTAGRLLYQTKADDSEYIMETAETIAILLQSAIRPLQDALKESGRISLLRVQRALLEIFRFARNCLTCAQYFESIQPSVDFLRRILASYFRQAAHVEAYLSDSEGIERILEPLVETNIISTWPDTLDAARRQVQDSLSRNWHFTDGRYFLKRGENSVEVSTNLDGEEKSLLLNAVKEFQTSYEAIFEGQRRAYYRIGDDCNVGAVIV